MQLLQLLDLVNILGDPKKPRKKYSKPRNPWRSDQLSQELYLVGTYGLRNKHELWKIQTKLSKIRKEARLALAASSEERTRKESILLKSLIKIGVIKSEAILDDVLNLTVENLLDRRLQTFVWKKGLTKSLYEARQMVTHGHIMRGDRIITIPGYTVESGEEETIKIRDDSPLKLKVVAPQSE